MDESKSGMSWLGVLFFVVILLVLMGGGLNGFGWGNRNGCGDNGCSRVSTCQVEKQEIIDSARTQYLIEQQAGTTRTAIRDSRDDVMAQASRIYEAQQSEKIFDLKMENQALKSNEFVRSLVGGLEKQLSDCCCGFNRRLDSIECQMLKRPELAGIATTCSGQIIPASFGGRCCNNDL